MKLLVGFAVLAVIGVVAVRGVGDRLDRGSAALATPSLPSGVPPQLQSIVASLSDARSRGVAAALHLSARSGDADVPAPFADRGSRRRIAAVRRAIRRTLRGQATRLDRTRVLAWQGVFVAGDRAVAVADVERTARSSRHARRHRFPMRRMAFGLVAGGGWRLVSTR
jgi:hypothetical protein